MKNWIEKILCRFKWHKWKYSYIFDKNVKWPRFHLISGSRKCKRKNCKAKQLMVKQNFNNTKIRWEK